MTVTPSDNSKKLEAPAPAPAAQAAPDIAEPKKRDEKKAEPTPKKDIKAVLGNWASDDS